MKHKNDYSVIAFMANGKAKKWLYVDDLLKFISFLDREHSSWIYMNVYERNTRKYLKRLYKGGNTSLIRSNLF